MKFIDIAIPKFGDDAPASPTNVQPIARERRNTNFRSAHIEEYNLHDHDHDHDDDAKSVRSQRTIDSRDDASSIDEKGEKFYEAQDDTTDVSPSSTLVSIDITHFPRWSA